MLFFVFLMALQPNAGHGFPILYVPRSHTICNEALESVGLLWTSDQPVAQTST